jgi:hypothetical protein
VLFDLLSVFGVVVAVLVAGSLIYLVFVSGFARYLQGVVTRFRLRNWK